MGVKLTDEEIDEFLSGAHTLIVATTRASGEPFMTPIWFVWMDGAFWIRTSARAAKVQHMRRDPRVCCLVEEGKAWIDLRAVVANCNAEFVQDADQIARFATALDSKYADFRMNSAAAPAATRSHYDAERAVIRMTPREGEIRSWYNRKIRMKSPS